MTRKKKLPGGDKMSYCVLSLLFIGLWLCVLVEQVTTAGSSELGSCFRLRKKDGSCGHVQKRLVTREECCSGIQRRGWSSSSPSNDSSALAYSFGLSPSSTSNSVISEQPTCLPCSTLCEGKKCGEDRKCVVRCGVPRCVCNPQCHLKHKEPVCGSDRRTYSSECHLLKRACRKKKRVLVAHYGPCQTCSGVKCPRGKQCVLNEQMTPACIRCPSSCPKSSRKPLCAADGSTYHSRCELKQASCQAGALIPRAYMGPCEKSYTCEMVKCWGNQTCLTSVETGQPQCTDCNANLSCRPSSRPVCASDGRTYRSWCAFRHEACRSGKALTPAHHQHCASNLTKSEDCRHASSAHSLYPKKHRSSNQQELEERQKEEHIQRQEAVMNEVHRMERLKVNHLDHPPSPDAALVSAGSAALAEETPTDVVDGDGESGQQLPEDDSTREKRKRSRRRKKKCKSRKRRRKDQTPRRIRA